MLDKINQTAEYIRSCVSDMPKTAIILGTGLGALVDHIEDKQYIPYKEIPNFPVSTVEGHSGTSNFRCFSNPQSTKRLRTFTTAPYIHDIGRNSAVSTNLLWRIALTDYKRLFNHNFLHAALHMLQTLHLAHHHIIRICLSKFQLENALLHAA